MHLSLPPVLTGVLTAVGTVLLLWAVQTVYNRTAVVSPLQTALRHVAGVQHVKVNTAAAPWSVDLWIQPDARLAAVYDAVKRSADAAAGQPVAIHLMDNPSAAEARLYERLQFVLAEGEATGQYVVMAETVSADARAAKVPASLTMEGQTFYLTLGGRQAHRLLAVWPLTLGGRAHD